MGTPKSANKTKVDQNYWRTNIETYKLNDDAFSLKVAILQAAGTDQDLMYLSKFESFAQEEKRFVIKNVTKTETYFMINQLGTEKKEQNIDLRVFEEAYEALKYNKLGLPTDITALVIKQKVIDLKKKYGIVQNQKKELKEGMKQESATMINRAEVKGTIAKIPERVEIPKETKKGKNEVSPKIEPQEGKKYNTLLREHGEEWRDKVYVDDYPIDGPNLYVALTGFTDSLLPGELLRIGIPLVAVVQIRVDPLYTKVPSSLTRVSKRGQSKAELLAEQVIKFWEDIQNLRMTPEVADEYKDVAFIAFKPPYWKADNLKGDPETIYDELSFLLYDIEDLSRQRKNYLENMDVITIEKETSQLILFHRYTNLIDKIPIECTSVFHLMDCILNSVADKCDERLSINAGVSNVSISKVTPAVVSKNSDAKEKNHSERAKNLVEKVFQSLLTMREAKHGQITSNSDEKYRFENPFVLDFGDFSSLISFHLPLELCIQDVIRSILINMPLNQLWKRLNNTSDEIKAKTNYHLNVLMHAFDRNDIEVCEICRLLNILGLKKLYNNRSSNDQSETIKTVLTEFKKIYLKRSKLSEPLHRLYSFTNESSPSTSSHHSIYEMSPCINSEISSEISPNSSTILFECPDISGLISAAELNTGNVSDHVIDHYEYFEEFNLKTSLQVLHRAFTEFTCVNYKYCPVTDSILILLYNSHNEDGISTKEWKTNLTTPVCMQDFFDFVIDDHYEWFQKEEKIFDVMVQERCDQDRLDDLISISNRSCLDQSDLDMEMLIEGSLKHTELVTKEITDSPSESETKSKNSPKKNKANHLTSGTDFMKSTKITPSQTTKMTKTNENSSIFSIALSEYRRPKEFLGYNLGDRRHEIFGRDAYFYSKDGTNISYEYFMMFPHNQEYATIKFISGNKNNEVYVHKALGMYTNHTLPDSVRIITKWDVQINFEMHSYEIIPAPIQSSDTNNQNSPLDQLSTDVPDKESYFPLVMSCPNGLVVESVHQNKSMRVLYIKQHVLRRATDTIDSDFEQKRCITKSGEVIVFKVSGNIEILFPDSSYILCTKYKRTIVEPILNINEPIPSITSLNAKKKTSKTNIEKDSKSKGRKSKEPVVIPPVTKIETEKEPIYELVLLEYFVIEADGTKKHFFDNHFELKEILLIRTATDYCLGEVFSRRMDGTNLLYNKDGMLTVTFPDKTRIVSSFYIEDCEVFPDWTEEEYKMFDFFKLKSSKNSNDPSVESSRSSNTEHSLKDEISFEDIMKDEGYVSVQLVFNVEHADYATVTVDTSHYEFTIDMPNSVSVTMNDFSCYKMKLDDMTIANLDLKCLQINTNVCSICNITSSCNITVSENAIEQHDLLDSEWLVLTDSFGKCVSVTYEGAMKIYEQESSEHEMHEEKGEGEDISQPKSNKSLSSKSCQSCNCREINCADKLRFFVLHRDMTVSELVHKLTVEKYKSTSLENPWSSVSEYDAFGDNRKLHSFISPIDRNESEKWLMESKFAADPHALVFKDLRADEDKGFYKWMRPYDRFTPEPRLPPPSVPPGLPRALVLRTLEQQWKENDPEKLRGGRELISAIIKYRHIMEEDKETMTGDPVRDPRSDCELNQYQQVQDLAQRTIEKLLNTMEIYKQAHSGDAKPLQIIRFPTQPDADTATLQGEQTSVSVESSPSSLLVAAPESGEEAVRELEAVVPMSPQLARYWRIREVENKEAQFYKDVLRHGAVPPYFETMLGGEVWWELNRATERAVDVAEDAKLPRCCCQHQPEVICMSDIHEEPRAE